VASYNYIRPPDFIKYAFYDYSDWDRYYDDFVYKQSGSRADFVASLNRRIVDGPYVQASVSFRIDDSYRHSRWYRHWRYEPYYSGRFGLALIGLAARFGLMVVIMESRRY
jgi:hypothetical protein